MGGKTDIFSFEKYLFYFFNFFCPGLICWYKQTKSNSVRGQEVKVKCEKQEGNRSWLAHMGNEDDSS